MDIFIEIIRRLAFVFLSTVELAMFIRAILSWFVMDGGGKLMGFLCAITEPFIAPVRALLVKMNWLQDTPIDFAFMITFLLISVVSLFLS